MGLGAFSIGQVHGTFDRDMLTFNPGWDSDAKAVPGFTDVRAIQRRLRAAGVAVKDSVDETGQGPGHIVLEDPDGNPVLIDQHL